MPSSCLKCSGFLSTTTQRITHRLFRWLGTVIYTYSFRFILIAFLLMFFCVGAAAVYYYMICIDEPTQCVENRVYYLWVPTQSIIWDQFMETTDTFGTYPSPMTLLLTSDDGSILTPTNMDTAFSILNTINNITENHYSYDDLCTRSVSDQPLCDSAIDNFHAVFFENTPSQWSDMNITLSIINAHSDAVDFYLSQLEYDESTAAITSAKSMRILYSLQGSTDQTVTDAAYEYARAWNEFWMDHYNDYPGLKITFFSDRFMDDEIARVATDEMPTFVAAFSLMLLYLTFLIGELSWIGARPWLALSAVIILLGSLLIGFSISLCCGFAFHSVVMLVPFILLGVGVDDMIILVDTYKHIALTDDNEHDEASRMGKALSSSGFSITLTSLCSVTAFFVGSFVDIPAVSSFCVYAAWSFFANYILQFLIFVPLLAIDERRIQKKKNACCPCCILHDDHERELSEMNNRHKAENLDSKAVTVTETVSAAEESHVLKDNCLTKLLEPVLTKRMPRLFIIFLFLCTFSASIYAIQFIEAGSEPENFLPDDSRVLHYMKHLDDSWSGDRIFEFDIIIKNQDFSRNDVRDKVYLMIADMEAEDHILGDVINWVDDFTVSLNASQLDVDDLDSVEFYNELQDFSHGTGWESEIVFDDLDNPTMIVSTRFRVRVSVRARYLKLYHDYVAWNDLYDEYFPSSSDGYLFHIEAMIGYFESAISFLTASNMIVAALGVFGVLSLFVDLRLAIFMLVIVSMIDVHLLAWMWMWDITLDGTAYIEVVMAVGLTVDYVIHITHSISIAEPRGNVAVMSNNDIYAEKWKIAMNSMGISVCKGALTTFIGVVTLAFSQSEAFRLFFKMFTGIIFLALAHGAILTPALLGECKFIYSGIKHIKTDAESARVSTIGMVADAGNKSTIQTHTPTTTA